MNFPIKPLRDPGLNLAWRSAVLDNGRQDGPNQRQPRPGVRWQPRGVL